MEYKTVKMTGKSHYKEKNPTIARWQQEVKDERNKSKGKALSKMKDKKYPNSFTSEKEQDTGSHYKPYK